LKDFLKTHKYYLALLVVPAYFIAFFALEKIVVTDYYVCYIPFLDDLIPFCEWFAIPYVLWYPYMLLTGITLLLFDEKEFLRFITLLFGSMFLCLFICLVFPNGQNLRPESFARDNVLTRLMGALYAADTNTNVLPSMHVIGSLATNASIWKSKHKFLSKPYIKAASLILCVLVCLATCFVKQHSALDGIAALVLFIPLYYLIYKFDLLFRKKKIVD